jgi:Tfp pilus assembly protein PilF
MTTKDYILVLISTAALIVSLFSLIVTLIQKSKETKRTIRKNLTDTIESISKIAIESAKLKASKDTDFNSEAIILLRRNYNSQRRALAAHADFLIKRYDKISTEIDCNILAGTYAIISDIERAEYYWQKTINKSISKPIRIMNLRGFGIFLFNNEKIELGRQYFQEALSIDIPENDENRVLKIDTCLMLCDMETEFGSNENYETSLMSAMEFLSKIKSLKRKDEMHERISQKLPSKIRTAV